METIQRSENEIHTVHPGFMKRMVHRDDLAAKAALFAMSLGVGTGAQAVLNAETVAADDMPAPHEGSVLEPGAAPFIAIEKQPTERPQSMLEKCIAVGLNASQPKSSLVNDIGTYRQAFILREHFDAVEVDGQSCNKLVYRKVSVSPEMKSPHGWLHTGRPKFQLAMSGNEAGARAQAISNHQKPTKGRFKMLTVLENPKNHHQLAANLQITPVHFRR